jgi:hypothetical protein
MSLWKRSAYDSQHVLLVTGFCIKISFPNAPFPPVTHGHMCVHIHTYTKALRTGKESLRSWYDSVFLTWKPENQFSLEDSGVDPEGRKKDS